MKGYISIKQILDDLLAHPLLLDMSLERAVNYTLSFILIVGMPPIFEEKTEEIKIENWRGQLPCDLYEIIQVRTNIKHCGENHTLVFRYSTDSFHMSNDKTNFPELTYKVQGRVIFTSMKEGVIEIAYQAIKVDEDGFPLIPDNSSFIRALELYIKKNHFTVLFDLGKINPAVYSNVQQEYAWAVGQAQSDLIRPTIDQMEAFSNSWNTLIPRMSEHKSGFVSSGTKEHIKLQ